VRNARKPPAEESATRARSMETSLELTYTLTTGKEIRKRLSPPDSPSTLTRTHLPDSEPLEKKPRPGRAEAVSLEPVTMCLEKLISYNSKSVTTILGGRNPF